MTLVLRREGVDRVTTNRIAETAGVSIGSVYQYFPDKTAMFVALHARHVSHIAEAVERTVIAHAASPLASMLAALVDVLVTVHAADPELYELMFREVPHRAAGAHELEARVAAALRLALQARREQLARQDIDRMLFVVTHMLESLSHAAALARPPRLSLEAAKHEVVRAVLAYLEDAA